MRRFPPSILLFSVYLALGCGEHRADPLPAVNDLESMEVTYRDPVEEKEVKFAVPQPHWSKIRDALLPASHDNNPAKWQGIGELEIKKKESGRVYIWLFSSPQGPGAFAIGQEWKQRVYYRGGQSAKLKQALQDAYKASHQGP